ncbi:uncharacterized protein MONBRDRAFT_15658 [Monosiga brevicollis MX1]|uniref:Protein yippee-like n=1 Tax=Monosiga brevicollis TaxID=81824 RepID=A9UUQ3_MONBE|nr:uncharacterized protein MONBRDRAFT_15658 [Monosiga brevicollis MX1]EDQ90762.1 predicted protein [Monosiga brevicollis MX1]|eukprot:XP_001744059.1 hypothetical protein [Monosiga brevicollis MX1]
MGRLFKEYLSDPRVYICANCHTHLAAHDSLVSKSFQGRLGRAYLFNDVVNIDVGPAQEKMLITGLHSICDVHCNICRSYLGWKYEMAYEQEQRYKIGKVILEKAHIERESGWH